MSEKEPENMDEVLRRCEGCYVELSYNFHAENILRWTRGVLRRVTKDLIEMEVESKDHFWERMTGKLYYLNRHACQLGSVVLLSVEMVDNGVSEPVSE